MSYYPNSFIHVEYLHIEIRKEQNFSFVFINNFFLFVFRFSLNKNSIVDKKKKEMNLKNRSISILIFYIFYEIIVTLISSINIKFLLISIIINLIVLIKERSINELNLIHYYSSLIYSFIHYIIFTLSYAEILPWETVIVIVLFILIIYYNKKLTTKAYPNW